MFSLGILISVSHPVSSSPTFLLFPTTIKPSTTTTTTAFIYLARWLCTHRTHRPRSVFRALTYIVPPFEHDWQAPSSSLRGVRLYLHIYISGSMNRARETFGSTATVKKPPASVAGSAPRAKKALRHQTFPNALLRHSEYVRAGMSSLTMESFIATSHSVLRTHRHLAYSGSPGQDVGRISKTRRWTLTIRDSRCSAPKTRPSLSHLQEKG